MRTMAWLCVFLFLAASDVRANEVPSTRLLDLSADTLRPGEWEIGLFWGRVARGFTPNLELATHALGWSVGAVNVFAKWRFFDDEHLKASVEGGVFWMASLGLFVDDWQKFPLLLVVPLELRATVPLADKVDLHLGGIGRWSVLDVDGGGFSVGSLRLDVSVSRSDRRGAWIATARLPLVTRARVKVDSLFGVNHVTGSILLDDLPAWGLLVAREQRLGTRWRARLGLGYRNTYGIALYESVGHLLVNLDLSWRRPPS